MLTSIPSHPSLGDRFFALPTEIQLQVINLLSFYDLLNVRRSSAQFRKLAVDHENYIVRHYVRVCVPNYITRLYPPNSPPNLRYLTSLAYKQRISTNIAFYLAEQVLKEMMGRRRRGLSKQTRAELLGKLRRGMAPLLFALFQFFESYRQRKLERLEISLKQRSRTTDIVTLDTNFKLQSHILSRYPDMLLLQVHQMYHLLLYLIFRRMTPPALSLARTFGLGKWSRRPSSNSIARVLVLGGISEVWQLYRIKGYKGRRKALDKYTRQFDARRFHETSLNTRAGATGPHGSVKREPIRANVGNPAPDTRDIWTPSISSLAKLDIDELLDVWTPAAEERLLSRDIIHSLDEVSCSGRFVSQLLWTDEDGEDDVENGEIDDADSDDSDDSGDDHAFYPDDDNFAGDEDGVWYGEAVTAGEDLGSEF